MSRPCMHACLSTIPSLAFLSALAPFGASEFCSLETNPYVHPLCQARGSVPRLVHPLLLRQFNAVNLCRKHRMRPHCHMQRQAILCSTLAQHIEIGAKLEIGSQTYRQACILILSIQQPEGAPVQYNSVGVSAHALGELDSQFCTSEVDQ